jgi:hypothetical protein
MENLKEALLSACTTLKQLVLLKAHPQDYVVVGTFVGAGLVAGLGLGYCLWG